MFQSLKCTDWSICGFLNVDFRKSCDHCTRHMFIVSSLRLHYVPFLARCQKSNSFMSWKLLWLIYWAVSSEWELSFENWNSIINAWKRRALSQFCTGNSGFSTQILTVHTANVLILPYSSSIAMQQGCLPPLETLYFKTQLIFVAQLKIRRLRAPTSSLNIEQKTSFVLDFHSSFQEFLY